jgi:acetyl-CoA decarbonylase/synthase complex subunit gamma
MGKNSIEIASWFLMIGGLSSFLAMNFTGSSTYTSLSGVQKEMKTALPAQIVMAGLGLIAWLASKFISL